MSVRVLLVENGGAAAQLRTIDGDLATFQSLVGGDVEALPLTEATSAYINEEGKRLRLAPNVRAEAMIHTLLATTGRCLMPGDWIAGPAVFVGTPDDDGYDTNVPAEAVDLARALLIDVVECD